VSSKISTKLTITPIANGGGGGGHRGFFFQSENPAIPTSAVTEETAIGASTEMGTTGDLPGFSVQGVVSSGPPSLVSQGGLELPATVAAGMLVPSATDGSGINLALPSSPDGFAGTQSVPMMSAAAEPGAAFNLTTPSIGGDTVFSPRFDLSSAVHSCVSTLAHDPATWRSATAAGFVASVLYWLNAGAERDRESQKRRGIFSESPIRA
jgi:hypothetical protein